MKKYVGIPLVLISIVIAAILIRNKPAARADQKGKNVPYVKTMMIFPQKIKASISSQGIIMPQTELALLSEIGSKVEWISPLMETGSSFSMGDTLIVLEKRDYELALITAESSVLNAEVNLQREKAESDLATKEWERVGAGAGSDLALRKPQLAQAKATFSAAKASLERAKRNLERTVFLAPFNGRVRSRNIEFGSTVFPGTLLGNIYATQYFEIRLPIADQDVAFTGLKFNGMQIASKNQLDVIINNAGITNDNILVTMKDSQWHEVINTNLYGTFNCTKSVVKYMLKQKSGKIVNISSIIAKIGNKGQTNYSASKAGIIGFTKSLAKELASRNINVNAINPGFIKTEMTDKIIDNQEFLNTIPFKKYGKAEDVANLTCFLSSEKSNYITGQAINIDGGLAM